MTGRVKLLVEFHAKVGFGSRDELLLGQGEARSTYLALTHKEQEQLAQQAITQIDMGNHRFEEILCCLACFRPGSLAPFHQMLVDHRILYPGVVYHGGSSDIAKQIIDLCKLECRDHALIALAWIGDETVQAAFSRWRKKPPAWASNLFVPPHQYALEAGWELTSEGKRRDLFRSVAAPLVASEGALGVDPSVTVGVPAEETCRWCKEEMVDLFRFATPQNVLPDQGTGPLRIVTCQACTCYSPVFMKYGSKGQAVWHRHNRKPDYLPTESEWDTFPASPLVMTKQTRHFMEAANWSMLPGVAFSQVGGLPTWIQDAEYPTCPDCSQKMPFVGQISNEDFMEYGEGIYYAFRCPQCNVTATCYQQT